jgi:hypothetical protein
MHAIRIICHIRLGFPETRLELRRQLSVTVHQLLLWDIEEFRNVLNVVLLNVGTGGYVLRVVSADYFPPGVVLLQ